MRLCVDYRKLNTLTEPDVHPLPQLSDAIDRLEVLKWSSTLDVEQPINCFACNWIISKKNSIRCTWRAVYIQLLAFGATNAHAAFQTDGQATRPRKLDDGSSLLGKRCCVYSRISRAEQTLLCPTRCRRRCPRLKPRKCFLEDKETAYVRHCNRETGIGSSAEELPALSSYQAKTTANELCIFLAFQSYIRRFIATFENPQVRFQCSWETQRHEPALTSNTKLSFIPGKSC